MPHSFGYRARTRDMFSRGFKENGVNHMSTYLTTYRLGDYVDIKVNPSVHKGMPFKFYHGRTGVVYDVTKAAVGVRVNKQHNGRILSKKMHIRVEHVRPSKCKAEVKRRITENEQIKKTVREGGEKQCLKRKPTQPKAGYVCKLPAPTTIQGLPFYDLV